jgi:hypothetical protein
VKATIRDFSIALLADILAIPLYSTIVSRLKGGTHRTGPQTQSETQLMPEQPNPVRKEVPAPRPRSPEARAAIYGLLGAIVGGLATFGGAYWTGHQTQSETQLMSERSAYVAYEGVVHQYAYDLIQLQNRNNQVGPSYAGLRTSLIAQVTPLWSDLALIQLISPQSISNDGQDILDDLFEVALPNNVKDLNFNNLSSEIRNYRYDLTIFKQATRAQINP